MLDEPSHVNLDDVFPLSRIALCNPRLRTISPCEISKRCSLRQARPLLCRLLRVSPILAIVLAAASACLSAQRRSSPETASLRRREAHSEISSRAASAVHVESSLVVAPVSVVDRFGQFMESIPRADFRILDNGVPQRIAQFGLAMEPVTAVLVIQTNHSVAPLLNQVRPLGSVFWGLLLGDYGESAVIGFADHVRVLQDFSSGPRTLKDTLRKIVPSGRKARLNDALALGIEMLDQEPATERRVIIAFSDGFDRGSKTTEAEVLRAAANSNTAVYGLRFAPAEASVRQSEEEWQSGNGAPSVSFLPLVSLAAGVGRAAISKNMLQQYATFTGGLAYTHWKKQSLQDQLQQIALDINSQYVLAYAPSNLKQKGFHRIQVEVSPRGLRVRTRVGYFYGSSEKRSGFSGQQSASRNP